MKRILYLTVILLFSVSMILLSGCNDNDGYPTNNFNIGYGLIKGSWPNMDIQMDNGKTLFVAAERTIDSISSDVRVEEMRVLVNYSILEDTERGGIKGQTVIINSLQQIQVKEILHRYEIEHENVFGEDPFVDARIWLSSKIIDDAWPTSKYLNIEFKYMRDDLSINHEVNLVIDEQIANFEGVGINRSDEHINLRLLHNAKGDRKTIQDVGRLSFDISNLVPEGKDSIKVFLSYVNERRETKTTSFIVKKLFYYNNI